MNSISEPAVGLPTIPLSRRHALVAAALALWICTPNRASALSGNAHAGIKEVSKFDASTWARLLRQGPWPAAYVFTATYCATCPAVFDQLQTYIAASHRRVELVAVVMDEQGERAMAHAHHYAGATRLYAFEGFAPEIRHSVDPKWRNITPYVVLLDRRGAIQRTIGPPDDAMLKTWLS